MKKKIYYLGNPHLKKDNFPLKIIPFLRKKFPEIDFVYFDPTEETEISENPVFLDSVEGLKKIRILTNIKNFYLSPRNSVHDFDLPVFLGLLIKLKKINSIKIIGVPDGHNLKKAVLEVARIIKRI